MKVKVPLARPSFNKNEEKSVSAVLKSSWVTQGPFVEKLETAVKNYTGAKYAVATSSATTALFLSLYIMGIREKDEVIVPSFSFIASANVICHLGAVPVFVDINPQTYNIDPSKIEEKITSRTKAVMAVDQVGLPCDFDTINAIAKKHKIPVLIDAACSLGSEYKGKKAGSVSQINCLSFHPRKVITTGEGGMILTSNKIWAERAVVLRNHGMETSDVKRHHSTKVIHEKYKEIGFNFRMSDIEASVGVEQMKKISLFIKKRATIANRYNQAFKNSKYITPPFVPSYCRHNWQSYVIKLTSNAPLSRDKLMQLLLDKGISTRRGVMASHLETPYRKFSKNVSLPQTEEAEKQTICLPMYSDMKAKDQNFVIKTILKYLG